MEDNNQQVALDKALKYDNILRRNREYQKTHTDKIREIKIRYYYKKKDSDPERYKEKLEKNSKYYQEVIKPKKLLKAEENRLLKLNENNILESLDKLLIS